MGNLREADILQLQYCNPPRQALAHPLHQGEVLTFSKDILPPSWRLESTALLSMLDFIYDQGALKGTREDHALLAQQGLEDRGSHSDNLARPRVTRWVQVLPPLYLEPIIQLWFRSDFSKNQH